MAKTFQPLKVRDCGARPGFLERRICALTIDLERDHGRFAFGAFEHIPKLARTLGDLPVTAFVEGTLIAERPQVVRALIDWGIDIQLHCYDHRRQEDERTLGRSIETYERVLGKSPQGYRANTYQLDRTIWQALRRAGIRWDSSIMPGIGLGANPDRQWRNGDYFVLEGDLCEFPVGTLRTSRIPLVQSYLVACRQLWSALSRSDQLPRLLVFNMHLVDLFRTAMAGPAPLSQRLSYELRWQRGRNDSLPMLMSFVHSLQTHGYEFRTLNEVRALVQELPTQVFTPRTTQLGASGVGLV